MKKLVSLSMLLSFFACNQGSGPSAKKISLKTEEDKIFYSMGVMMGRSLARLSLSDKEMQVLTKGLYDSARDQGVQIKDEELMQYQPKIQNLFKSRNEKLSKDNKSKGVKYLEDYKKKAGVKTTASGLAYTITKPGTGENPKTTDTVEVHYHGKLIDGTVFDSSKDRGKTTQFPLNQVIKGWTEGLQLMKEGGEATFVIPSDLAYGDSGRPPKIPAGATLIFDVELKRIVKDAKKPMVDPHAGHNHGPGGHDAAVEKAKAAAQSVKDNAGAAAQKVKEGASSAAKKLIKGGNATVEKIKEATK